MAVPVNLVVDEAIRYEEMLSALYQAFSAIFEQDSELWWELSVSEGEHAMMLEASRTLFNDSFSRETVPADLESLRESNDSLESVLRGFEKTPPSREEAFRLALALEGDENEMTLHRLVQIEPSQPASEVVSRIRKADATHQQTIRAYAESHGVQL